ncbi:MAG TPA: hypothetical protein VHE83_16380, partial [Mycobacteriales bacterium]|nr:hypothetical protein [Mycobacteriales bacterium]
MGRHEQVKPARTRFAIAISAAAVASTSLLAVISTTSNAGADTVDPVGTLTHATGLSAHLGAVAHAAGNNGTIKIDDIDVDDSSPANDPHVDCTFQLRFWGFDSGDDHATVAFDAQSPSGHGAYPNTQGSLDFHFTGSGVGSTLDHVETYTLDPTGFTAQPNQGFHAKVTTHVTTSNGSTVKH